MSHLSSHSTFPRGERLLSCKQGSDLSTETSLLSLGPQANKRDWSPHGLATRRIYGIINHNRSVSLFLWERINGGRIFFSLSMCDSPCGRIRGTKLWIELWHCEKESGGGDVGVGGSRIVLTPLGIYSKFTPAPHFPTPAGVMRGVEGEGHSWA